jgi:glutamate--cysteine ligase
MPSLFDADRGGSAYADALTQQAHKLDDPESTPSANLPRTLSESKTSFHEYSLAQSQEHADRLRAQPLPAEKAQYYAVQALGSLQEQTRLEHENSEDFDSYVARYQAALKDPLRCVANQTENIGIGTGVIVPTLFGRCQTADLLRLFA